MPVSWRVAGVVRHLRQNDDFYATMSIEAALTLAFRALDEETARFCFYNCYGQLAL